MALLTIFERFSKLTHLDMFHRDFKLSSLRKVQFNEIYIQDRASWGILWYADFKEK
jgi:hypothetical protein